MGRKKRIIIEIMMDIVMFLGFTIIMEEQISSWVGFVGIVAGAVSGVFWGRRNDNFDDTLSYYQHKAKRSKKGGIIGVLLVLLITMLWGVSIERKILLVAYIALIATGEWLYYTLKLRRQESCLTLTAMEDGD
ncbi:hypothetical protein [Falsibacillus albus]|uniref:DUF3796 domain-containing protein n=1 Tax=Falsibacillus albus TaxID=2478915 RepID=A0A3L7JU81_9BACI|nr:hypothetical protein [Falsibacillus albus]RLQ94333.1 hypothetical protein D9X91_14865 [Falsibacillus albus]